MKSSEGNEISERAFRYAKQHAKEIVERETREFSPEENPVSSFMAGSPGAGKTETSKSLLENTDSILRIDADDLRSYFKGCGYHGSNSHLFQKAATKLVHEIHDAALRKRISFLLDGTFSNEKTAKENIERSLKRNRPVFILFVYQSPRIAWDFVQKREIVEGRRIRKEDFAEKFCASREVVNKMKKEFGSQITVRLICKNLDGTEKFYKKNVERIDDHIPERYDKDQILDEIRDCSIE